MKGVWTTIEIAGHPADVYESPGGSPRFGVLHLHGVGFKTLRDRPAFTRLFDELKLACVCPHGGPCWWADRICAEFAPQITPEKYLLQNVLPYFKERWCLEPPAVGLLGVGMGGQGHCA